MALSRIHSIAFIGLDAVLIDVEVDVAKSDKQSLIIVGLPDTSVKESKDRVLAAVKNSNFPLGNVGCLVNLAPGNLRKEGALYDLPIAIGLLISLGKFTTKVLDDYIIIGELALSGETRPLHGALAMAMFAKEKGKKGILIPEANAREAAAVPNLDVIPVRHLDEAVQYLQSPDSLKPVSITISSDIFKQAPSPVDFADIKGQLHVKRAMEIAAAGEHNILLCGPPGSGKTMLAKALVGIMPELTVQEALEATKIHSIVGLIPAGQSLITQRPFRSPHHTVSYAGLIGGGNFPQPGEVSLAHNGILFLDELPEFSRSVLEVLRQPLEDRKVTISRANGCYTFPTSFLCVLAMNPCPCGYLGHPEKSCKDTQIQIARYRGKISGPLWDRIDMHIDVPALRYRDMLESKPSDSSSVVRERIRQARKTQAQRFGCIKTNARMSSNEIKHYVPLGHDCHEILRQAIDGMGISARSCDRILRVARTIADLADVADVRKEHVMEAIGFRQIQSF